MRWLIRQVYERTKTQLLEFPNDSEATKDLRTYARHLDDQEDCEEFIQRLPKDEAA